MVKINNLTIETKNWNEKKIKSNLIYLKKKYLKNLILSKKSPSVIIHVRFNVEKIC